MGEGAEAFAGLNKNGVIVFIILLIVCLPICWLPWVIDSLKAAPAGSIGDVEPEQEEGDE